MQGAEKGLNLQQMQEAMCHGGNIANLGLVDLCRRCWEVYHDLSNGNTGHGCMSSGTMPVLANLWIQWLIHQQQIADVITH